MRLTSLHRYLAAAVLVAPLVTCGGPDPGRADLVAEAGPLALTPDRVAGWVARVPNRAPQLSDAEFAALVWVDYSLLAQAVAAGRPLTDSATVAASLEPDVTLALLRTWHDTLVARRPRVAADLPDSLYASDSLRLFQHILLRVTNPQDVRVATALGAQADSLLRQARDGASFEALARAHSDDATGRLGGWLPIARPGALPRDFERAAWGLAPGQLGGVVSRAGFHVVRRPPLAEVRDRFLGYAEAEATRVADAAQADSLLRTRGYAVTDQAVGTLRRFFDDPRSVGGETMLARWEGGGLTLADARAWIDLLTPRAYLELRGASDNTLTGFVRDLSLQALLAEQARAAGTRVSAAEMSALRDGYRRSLRESLALVGLTDTTTLGEAEVAGRVSALLDALTADRVTYRPLPSALGAVLRRELGYRLHRAGLEAAARSAQAMARDTAGP